MQEIIKYAQSANVQQFWLHATKAGHPLYEKMGFVALTYWDSRASPIVSCQVAGIGGQAKHL
jgi:hypothetical protein